MLSDGYLVGTDADLQDAMLSGAQLSRGDLAGANITDADFSGANLIDAEMATVIVGNNFTGCRSVPGRTS